MNIQNVSEFFKLTTQFKNTQLDFMKDINECDNFIEHNFPEYITDIDIEKIKVFGFM